MKKFISGIILIVGLLFTYTFANATVVVAPHWEKSPIQVYIPKDTYSPQMQRAFQKWQNESFGKLKFKFVTKGPADIDVIFTDKVDGSDSPIASYSVTIQGKKITKAEIKFASQDPKLKKYSKNYIYTTMLHEVGHALGLSDTYRKKTMIMYMPITEKQDITSMDIINLFHLNGWSYSKRRFEE